MKKNSPISHIRGLCSESNSSVRSSISSSFPQDRINDALPQEPLRLVRLATRQPYKSAYFSVLPPVPIFVNLILIHKRQYP